MVVAKNQRPERRALSQDMGLADVDKGRVEWFRAGAWRIIYEGLVRKKRRVSQSLHVPLRSLAGDLLSPSAYEEAKAQVLQKARRLWNSLDKTDAERYEL